MRYLCGVVVVFLMFLILTGCGAGNAEKMILISSGSFWKGCDEDLEESCSREECREREMPYVQVSLPNYYIDETEVTQAAFQECVDAGACSHHMDDGTCEFTDEYPSGTQFHGKRKPVVCVDYYQALEYCKWIGKRLPSEDEWEKAARGTDGRCFPWGNDGNVCEYTVAFGPVEWEGVSYCGPGHTMDVCSKTLGNSPYGLCDMSGNVSEWVVEGYARGGDVGDDDGYGTWCKSWGLKQPERYDGVTGFRCAMDANL